jgi:hypothetical protein
MSKRKTDQPIVPGDAPYLEIRNWAKFQRDHKGQLRDGIHSDWIKDYTEKEWDEQYSALGVYERYALDMCRRVRGSTGKRLPNRLWWVIGRSNVAPRERANLAQALTKLGTKGFLTPANEALSVPRVEVEVEVEVDKNRVEEGGAPSPTTPKTKTPKSGPSADSAFSLADYSKPIGGFSEEQVRNAIAWARECDPGFWVPKLGSEKSLERNIARLVQQCGDWQPKPKCPDQTFDANCADCSGTGFENRSGNACHCVKYWRTKEHKEECSYLEFDALLRDYVGMTPR